jgi:dihydroorotate dehydrogenase (NAD+) catalytic subunit
MNVPREVAGVAFQNPIVLASGTAGYGAELSGVINLSRLGGMVTKAVSLAPRAGNLPPRVAEFPGGMINSVGLANPGAAAVAAGVLQAAVIAAGSARVLVNVVGFKVDEYAAVIRMLDHLPGHVAYELNLSCPNTSAGGVEFGADPAGIAAVVTEARAATNRPLFAKLSPALANIPDLAAVAIDAGADGVTLVNTMPGMIFDGELPRLGNGFGGVSGPALKPTGLLAVQRTASRLPGVPIIAAGGVRCLADVNDYLRAGAMLVAIGTAALADPRLPERIADQWESQWRN